MFSTLINSTRDRMAKRRRYNQLVDEIMGMSSRDLSDINGSRSDMLHHAYKEVYGALSRAFLGNPEKRSPSGGRLHLFLA